MAYFHAREPVNRGGMKRRLMRKVLGETIEELLFVGQTYPDHTTINLPPRGKNCWRSRSLPFAFVDNDQIRILEALESVEVGDEYLHVITWLLRKEHYERYGDGSQDRWFQRELTGNMSRLLRSEQWVDEPEDSSLVNLNAKLGKIDLGRRSDLKLSTFQPETAKYDADLYRKNLSDLSDVDQEYHVASPTKRTQLRRERPWLAKKWIQDFGE